MCKFTGLAFSQENAAGRNSHNFFPIAVWAQNPVNATAYGENGINMYISIHGGLDQEKLDHLRKANMKVIAHQNSFGLSRLDEPLIYGWMHGDEPDNAQRSRVGAKSMFTTISFISVPALTIAGYLMTNGMRIDSSYMKRLSNHLCSPM